MSDVEEACGHERCHSYMWNGTCWCVVAQWFHGAHTTRVDAVTCDDCGAWLSLGPARDDGEHAHQVAIEIVAAQFASDNPHPGYDRFEWCPETQSADLCVLCEAHYLASIANSQHAATHDPREEQG